MPQTTIRPKWSRNTRPYAQRFCEDITFEMPSSEGEVVVVEQSPGEEPHGDGISTVWDAALVLSGWLCGKGKEFVQGKNVIEIGAGCGLCGILSGKLGASKVILTEREDYLPLLHKNIAKNNSGGNVFAATFDWEVDKEGPMEKIDVVIGTDVVYEIQSLPCLHQALMTLTNPPNSNAIVLLANERRWVDVDAEFDRLMKKDFEWTIVNREELDSKFQLNEIDIVVAKRRSRK